MHQAIYSACLENQAEMHFFSNSGKGKKNEKKSKIVKWLEGN
jgi:hypothetical protein